MTGAVSGQQIDALFEAHFAATISEEMIAGWRKRFLEEGLVFVPQACPPDLLAAVLAEVDRLIEGYAVRQDFMMPATSNTPRRLRSVRRSYIAENSGLIPAVYRSPVLLGLASRIAGEEVVLCPYEDEQFVISRLTERGDTHGWHWDDYAYGMVWVLEAPPLEDGGFVQCVPGTQWNKQDPRLYETLCSHPIRSYAAKSGDLYFLRSDTTLHGVYPLQRPSRRTILNLAWANRADLDREVSHETTDNLYVGRAELETA
jgi:L-lysine 4-chlorinase